MHSAPITLAPEETTEAANTNSRETIRQTELSSKQTAAESISEETAVMTLDAVPHPAFSNMKAMMTMC